ncbi:MAG: hypothetical protein IKE60_16915 [Reyranella sp.]|jgi:hypothetical protein|uniref:hypothetical protein n=1 Tax=Reyranella sp. TaxID=1929291 RepID=UPI00095AEB70|nr:hypothetical protein [Reyranella sp.]MBN9537323.1 hypothetical protein [Alphaproteobacteria bacterium]MBR2816337.1 hypothetical protein [Reyranella sp.]OJU33992.1 MAG: hypothetical protein BGN99_28245 [Alphaproteobacteria bacterium 65-37]
MNRRAFLVAVPIVAGSTGASLLGAALPGTAAAAAEVKVIYVGGWDCEPCSRWKNQHKPSWLASPEFQRVTWIEVDVPRLKEAYRERYWPGDLKPVLDQLPQKGGTPRFLIVQDGRVVSNEFGSNKWAQTMTDLRNILR